MKIVFVRTITREHLEVGEIMLLGKYPTTALKVPGYGWVPCSKYLTEHMTTSPSQLMLRISEKGDKNIPASSNIWICRETISYELDQVGLGMEDVYDEVAEDMYLDELGLDYDDVDISTPKRLKLEEVLKSIEGRTKDFQTLYKKAHELDGKGACD